MKKRESILIAAASLLIPGLVSAYNYCYQEVEKQQYVADPLAASGGYYQIWTDMIRVPCDATVTYDFITPAPLAGVYYETSVPDQYYYPVRYYPYYNYGYGYDYLYGYGYGYGYEPVYTYETEACNSNGNTVAGALAGAALGNIIAGDDDATAGTIFGAILGGGLASAASCN